MMDCEGDGSLLFEPDRILSSPNRGEPGVFFSAKLRIGTPPVGLAGYALVPTKRGNDPLPLDFGDSCDLGLTGCASIVTVTAPSDETLIAPLGESLGDVLDFGDPFEELGPADFGEITLGDTRATLGVSRNAAAGECLEFGEAMVTSGEAFGDSLAADFGESRGAETDNATLPEGDGLPVDGDRMAARSTLCLRGSTALGEGTGEIFLEPGASIFKLPLGDGIFGDFSKLGITSDSGVSSSEPDRRTALPGSVVIGDITNSTVGGLEFTFFVPIIPPGDMNGLIASVMS